MWIVIEWLLGGDVELNYQDKKSLSCLKCLWGIDIRMCIITKDLELKKEVWPDDTILRVISIYETVININVAIKNESEWICLKENTENK